MSKKETVKLDYERTIIQAFVDVKLLKRFPVSAIARESGISTSAIRTAIVSGGHVRQATKDALEIAFDKLLKDPKYMTFIEAVQKGVVSKEEADSAFVKLYAGADNGGSTISFEKWDCDNEPVFVDHNQCICMLDELRGKVSGLWKKVLKAIPDLDY